MLPRSMTGKTLSLAVAMVVVFICAHDAVGDDGTPVEFAKIENGVLSVVLRDNSRSPGVLSGLDSLFSSKAPGFDAFDPDTVGASAGLNFEHIISGHKNVNNKFTPRHGTYRLYPQSDSKTVKLVRRAEDSPWKVDSELRYSVVAPHYVDFEFRCTPRDASLFGQRGYALFFFANYMNDVANVALNFRGHEAANSPEQWIVATGPREHAHWNGGGNYRAKAAADLEYDEDVEFRLNTWTYDWPRVSKPFYYGLADHGMTMILMFDRLHSSRDQIRFSLYKFKLPKHPRPAWDFQYVINHVNDDEEYGFKGRLVWKKFVSASDCMKEYQQWTKSVQATRVRQLRELGATVFTRGDSVVEVNANRTRITDKQLELVSDFVEMTDLSLEETEISDSGLSHVSNLQKLEWLNLYRCPVGNKGLETLKQLKNLQHLPIGNSLVTDEGLRHLADMRQLLYLGLRGSEITDRGMKWLGQLTQLTGLHLAETKVTDAGLNHLIGMRKLRQLWLDGTSVTDQAVEVLSKLHSLSELHIRETRMTATGVKRLQRALPNCEIGFSSN